MNYLGSKEEKKIILAYDQGMEIGPKVFDSWSANAENIFDLASRHNFAGIALQKGPSEMYSEKFKLKKLLSYNVPPLIVKVNGKTSINSDSDKSVLNCSLDYALELGAKSIGYTIYLGSRFESEMISEASKVQEFCRANSVPFILWSYPKIFQKSELDLLPETISYCSRIAFELGADYVKLKYPKFDADITREDKVAILSEIVAMANTCKVLFQGGQLSSKEEFLNNCSIINQSGANGMAIGRNIWSSTTPDDIIKEVFEIWGLSTQ